MLKFAIWFTATLAGLALWTGLVVFGTLNGWLRDSVAPTGDARAFMDATVEHIEANLHGNVAFVLLEDGEIFDEYFASVGDPVDRDTVFQVASLSKWITAWGIMTLIDDGTLDLDVPVSTYLTRWQLPESEFDNDGVTVRRLLSHTAGLTDGLGYGGFLRGHPFRHLKSHWRSRIRHHRKRITPFELVWSRVRNSNIRAGDTRSCSW